MKQVIGFILIIAGIALGLYLGLYVCFIGGIVDVVEFIRDETLPTSHLAWGILKVVCAGFVGTVSGYIVSIVGVTLLK